MGGVSPRVAECEGTLRRESRGQLLQKKKRVRSEKLVSSVRQPARDQAEQEARRIPWQLLLEARNQK
jgi:hypothetical protein